MEGGVRLRNRRRASWLRAIPRPSDGDSPRLTSSSGRRGCAPEAGWGRILTVAIILAGIPSVLGCGSPSPAPRRSESSTTGPDQTFRDLELRESSDGRLQWVLHAKRATRASGAAPTRLDSLKVDFYQGGPTIRSVLTSDSGRVNSEQGSLVATGHVVVVTPEGNKLETEELYWDRKMSKVYSDKFVKLTRQGDVLTGIGFTSDPNLESYELKKEIKASVHDQGPIQDEFLGPDTSRSGR